MQKRTSKLKAAVLLLSGYGAGINAAALPSTVDVAGPDGSMSRWLLSNGNTNEGRVASDGVTIDRYDAFDGHHWLTVDGASVVDSDGDFGVTSNASGTFIDYDPMLTGAYTTNMQWAFLEGSGAFRQYVTITNDSDATESLDFSRFHNMGSDGAGTIISSADGDFVAENTDAWFATDDGNATGWDPAIIYSFFSGTGVSPTAITNGGPISNGWEAQYSVSLALGESISFLWFTQMHADTSGALAGTGLFDEIPVDSDLLVGLSSAQLASIANHDFGEASEQVPVPATLGLLGLGMIGVSRRRFGSKHRKSTL